MAKSIQNVQGEGGPNTRHLDAVDIQKFSVGEPVQKPKPALAAKLADKLTRLVRLGPSSDKARSNGQTPPSSLPGPGDWLYNLLPYVEQDNFYFKSERSRAGSGGPGAAPTEQIALDFSRFSFDYKPDDHAQRPKPGSSPVAKLAAAAGLALLVGALAFGVLAQSVPSAPSGVPRAATSKVMTEDATRKKVPYDDWEKRQVPSYDSTLIAGFYHLVLDRVVEDPIRDENTAPAASQPVVTPSTYSPAGAGAKATPAPHKSPVVCVNGQPMPGCPPLPQMSHPPVP